MKNIHLILLCMAGVFFLFLHGKAAIFRQPTPSKQKAGEYYKLPGEMTLDADIATFPVEVFHNIDTNPDTDPEPEPSQYADLDSELDPDPYADIDYDALVVKFITGDNEIIPVNEIRFLGFELIITEVNHLMTTSSVAPVRNFPNPFSATTSLEFALEHPGDVDIYIFDMTGRLLRTFYCHDCPTGTNRLVWDGKDLSGHLVNSGVYVCRLYFDGRQSSHKMIFMKQP